VTGSLQRFEAPLPRSRPALPADELLGSCEGRRKPVDMREVIARLVDGSDLLEFKANYGSATVCAHADVFGMPVGILTNNARSTRGLDQGDALHPGLLPERLPLLYLQNTTATSWARNRAGRDDQARSKMIQAVANASVPQ